METRANNALIGLFTLAVIAAAFGFVYWFARTGDNGSVNYYRVEFSDSITGLSVGSNVLFNGIRVGSVDDLEISPEDPSAVIARIAVRDDTPIKSDTRAKLEVQGLTGAAYIQLVGGSADAPPLAAVPPEVEPFLKAERSEFQNLLDGAREVITQASQTIGRVDDWLKTNEADLTQTVKNVTNFSQALSDNAENVSDFLSSTGEAARSITALSNNLNAMTDELDAIIKAVDPQKVTQTLDNVDKFTAALGNNADQIDGFIKDARTLAGNLSEMTPKIEATFDGIQKVTASLDNEKIGRVVDNVDKFAQALGDNSQTVDAFIKDAGEIGKKLNAAADRIDTVLANIEGMTTGPEGKGMFTEISAAARAIRDLAEKLDGRTAEITAGITEFTGSGLRDYKQLAIEGQKTLRSIDRALKSFERNPQQVIFGPRATIPEYRGR